MEQTYFLGANTKDGFYSLYDGFPPKGKAFLHIIKGGPGTGKSSFMRRIGQAAEAQGLDVEYVICSGDPDSLDGVYIPALASAWVDGTSPHVIEPVSFGLDSDYVNLGKFCHLPLEAETADYVNQITQDYKALYQRAYGYLKAAASLRAAALPPIFGQDDKKLIFKRIDGILDRFLGRSRLDGGGSCRRFYSAISCLGEYRLTEEISKLCKLIYQIDKGFGGADMALQRAAEGAIKRGAHIILCASPLDPSKLEAVLIPGCGLAFADAGWDFEQAKHMRIDSLIPTKTQQELRPELREAARLEKQLLSLAYEKLSQAKALHDKLEAEYKPYMDFAALTKYTESEIKKLFR